mgnify:CR=1 FL=1
MSRIMIAATGSGSGKTTIVCGLCQCLKDAGLTVSALKCGPDYIDSMFHSRVLNMKTGNLDSWFCDNKTIKELLKSKESQSDITIIEGVMGYYDGQGFSTRGSSYEIADITDTPVILIVNCSGMSNSIGAVLKGYKEYIKNSHIKGVIFNNLSPKLYKDVSIEAHNAGITPLGYMPHNKSISLESRHLGLVTSNEVEHFREKIDIIAKQMKESIDIEGIIRLSDSASSINNHIKTAAYESVTDIKVSSVFKADTVITDSGVMKQRKDIIRIAVAKDEAFCFLYEDNLDFLRKQGCELIYFSPLRDKKLPDNIDGLLLYGGYPELHARALSDNISMREDIADKISKGLPCIAECGGYLYLHNKLETPDGEFYPMVGIMDGTGYNAGKLQRFGYMTLRANKDTMLAAKGHDITAHEFHYWNSDCTGADYSAYSVIKASDKSVVMACYGNDTMYAGFPHIYFPGNKEAAVRFIMACSKYNKQENINKSSTENKNADIEEHKNIDKNIFTTHQKSDVTDNDKEHYNISDSNHTILLPELAAIKPVDKYAMQHAQRHWDGIAKPLHGLGAMEDMVVRIAGIQGSANVSIDKKAVIVMCADNGIVEEGVTQTGQDVTAVVSCNMADGISSVCRMASCADARVIPVNIGIASDKLTDSTDIGTYKGLINKRVMPGTRNFLKEPAMTSSQLIEAIHVGIDQVKWCKDEGYNIIATGEMGIGNTTTSTALASILLNLKPEDVTGRGAGLTDKGLKRKTEVVAQAKEKYGIYKDRPLELLRCIGGLDVAGLVGVYIGGAMYKIPVIVDGVISAVAAIIAVSLCKDIGDYILVSHQGREPAMSALLAQLGMKAVIHADLALGEGTGAVMLFPLLDMTMKVYKENTTFDDIQITAYEDYGKC